MRKIRELLRLKYELGRSHREIATSLGIANSKVSDYVRRAVAAGLSWPLPEGLDDAALEAALFPALPPSRVPRPEPDWQYVHRELQRHKGVTLQLLWLEYRAVHPNGYQYSRFCDRYRAWRGRLDVVMRQVYRAGEKAFVDYAGPKFEVVDRSTGEVCDAMVFVGVLGRLELHLRGRDLEPRAAGLGDVPRPDVRVLARRARTRDPGQREGRSAQGQPLRAGSEPDIPGTGHALRHHRALGELREAIAPLLAALNERPFQKTEGSRRSWFEDLDRPALKPLPAQRYEYAEWRKARVNIDYHIQVEHALYSVPYPLARSEVDVRLSATTVEIFHKHRRVAAHLRIRRKGGYATEPAHMPAAHRAHAEWTPSRLIAWGRKAGPHTAAFVERLLESRPHPEQGYRSCLGLMKLLRAYSAERLEAACRRALDIGTLSYGSVKSILATGLDQAGNDEQHTLSLPAEHAHIRGPEYYTNSPNGKES